MSITMPRRRRSNKDFATLWAEQRSAPLPTTPQHYPARPYYGPSAFAPGGFASDTILSMLARPQQSADRFEQRKAQHDPVVRIAELDLTAKRLLRDMQPSRTETTLASMDSTIRRMKAMY
jgi:hypothetical protein